MKFSISVHSDDGAQIDYSVNLLSAEDAVKFVNGWQAQQNAAQQERVPDACPECGGKKKLLDSAGYPANCHVCNGTGKRR